jgi:hypothetical protein
MTSETSTARLYDVEDTNAPGLGVDGVGQVKASSEASVASTSQMA